MGEVPGIGDGDFGAEGDFAGGGSGGGGVEKKHAVG
jgi:hypothetical protein